MVDLKRRWSLAVARLDDGDGCCDDGDGGDGDGCECGWSEGCGGVAAPLDGRSLVYVSRFALILAQVSAEVIVPADVRAERFGRFGPFDSTTAVGDGRNHA